MWGRYPEGAGDRPDAECHPCSERARVCRQGNKLSGKGTPIIDFRCRLGLPRKDDDKRTRIVVVECRGKVVGIVVEAVNEVLRVARSVIEAPSSVLGGVKDDYIKAVGKLEDRLLILLDLEMALGGGGTTG